MQIECPFCEEVFYGTYADCETELAEHIEIDHAPEDLPSGDEYGYAPPRGKHTQPKTARRLS